MDPTTNQPQPVSPAQPPQPSQPVPPTVPPAEPTESAFSAPPAEPQPPLPEQPEQSWQPEPSVTSATPELPPQPPVQPVQPGVVLGGVPPTGNSPFSAPNASGEMGMGAATPPPSKKVGLIIGLVVAVLIVIGAGVAGFMLLSSKDDASNGEAAKESSATNTSPAVDIATLSKITMNVPATIEGFTLKDSVVPTFKDFISTDDKCEFAAGTVTVASLPGATLDDIITPQLDQLRELGATVTGPTALPAIILKDATDSSKTYKLSTIKYQFSADDKRVTTYYSVAILTGTDRAIINRTCTNEDGTDDIARIEAMESLAKKITVTKQ